MTMSDNNDLIIYIFYTLHYINIYKK